MPHVPKMGGPEPDQEIEQNNYSNPPRSHERKAVEGLRGAAAVLMVAAFENYLRQCVEEYLAELTKRPLKLQFNALPDKMKIHSVFTTLQHAMDRPPYEPSKK